MATNPDTALTAQQAAAVDLLAAGRTVTDTADAIGVTRQTVSEWLHHNPEFQAALNLRRHELWTGLSDRLRAALPRALDVLELMLQANDLRAALAIIKAAGPATLAPVGPTTAEDIEVLDREQDSLRKTRLMMASL